MLPGCMETWEGRKKSMCSDMATEKPTFLCLLSCHRNTV